MHWLLNWHGIEMVNIYLRPYKDQIVQMLDQFVDEDRCLQWYVNRSAINEQINYFIKDSGIIIHDKIDDQIFDFFFSYIFHRKSDNYIHNDDFKEWSKQNALGIWGSWSDGIFVCYGFQNEEDAVAFKLYWN